MPFLVKNFRYASGLDSGSGAPSTDRTSWGLLSRAFLKTASTRGWASLPTSSLTSGLTRTLVRAKWYFFFGAASARGAATVNATARAARARLFIGRIMPQVTPVLGL